MAGRAAALIDANLLALWIVGNVAESEVPRCRRTRHYSIDDFRMLSSYLLRFGSVVITPNIATEASNLIGVLSGKYLERVRAYLANAVTHWEERYMPSFQAVEDYDYLRLGLTDAAILLAASRTMEVLTDDFDLYQSLLGRGMPVTNFTHLRSAGWLGD